MRKAIVSSVFGALIAMFAAMLLLLFLNTSLDPVAAIQLAMFVIGVFVVCLMMNRGLTVRFAGAWTPGRVAAIVAFNVIATAAIFGAFELLFR